MGTGDSMHDGGLGPTCFKVQCWPESQPRVSKGKATSLLPQSGRAQPGVGWPPYRHASECFIFLLEIFYF